MATLTQSEGLWRTLRDVYTLAIRELLAIWRTLDTGDARSSTDALLLTLPPLADGFAAVAADVAADWYAELRRGAGVRSPFLPVLAGEVERGRVEALVRWGVTPLWSREPSPEQSLSKVSGGLQRIVANGARETVRRSAERDPVQPRVARYASANACAFCALLATRGAVYTEATGDFKSHDDCRCIAVPVFPGSDYQEAPYVADWRRAYQEARTDTGDPKEILSNMRQIIGTN